MKTIFLKITNTEIYFNGSDSIRIENTNIPNKHLKFRTEPEEVFWEVELIGFSKLNEELSVKVFDYSPQGIDSFQNQKCKYPFNRIKFDLLDWQQVEIQLSSYQESAIKEFFTGVPERSAHDTNNNLWTIPKSKKTGDKLIDSEVYSTNRRIEEVFRINISDLQFHEGFVSILKKLNYPDKEIRIVIHNSTFRKEFDYIKEFFIRYFGRKTVKVFVDFDYDIYSDKITNEEFKCPDLEEIDESVIEAIKTKRTNILKRPSQKETKSILDLEELFQVMNDPSAGINVFNQSEEDVINHFINVEGKKNKLHLSFLAKDLHQNTEKIRFTIHPIFGFIFSYGTETNSFLIWELLDSHATYIWYLETNKLSEISLYSEFEKAIEYIRGLGREVYKLAYKEGKISEDIRFKTISHNRTDASGFKKWQEKLNSIIG